ncbi:MAG: hypothetical protein GX786_11135, partial [Clostridiales bacterium]|nr:hypothetical protein [Clostridiales bacterium]
MAIFAPRKKKKKTVQQAQIAYSPKGLMIKSLVGIFLIALGLLSLLALYGAMEGIIFSTFQWVLYGLGGSLTFMIPIFLVWAGILLAFSGR